MKKRWRWPLAGFVLGALAGATVLTVNVVGASSPAPVAVRAAGFGEILHTPVLLARAGTSVSSLGGQTRNPYDLTRTPGGSSGGTGAAIAANFGVLGTGSDTGCSSIGPSFVAVAPTRSWNGLLSALGGGAAVAGTVFAGVVSALISGGLAEPPEPGDVNAR